MADDPGALLLRQGLISEDEALIARESAGQLGGTLAEHLVLANAITDDDLTEAIADTLRLPRVNPDDLARIAPEVITLVPADMAIELRTIPVAMTNGELTVAMGDPSDAHALDELAFFTDLHVLRAVATQRQIAWCLGHYYGFVTELGQTLLAHDDSAGPEQAPAPVPRAARRPLPLSDTHQVVSEPPADSTQALLSGLAGDAWTAIPGQTGDTTAPAGPLRKKRKPLPREEPAPELLPRAGEVAVKSEREATPRSADTRLPAVLLDPELSEATDVVILDVPKRRAARSTDLGTGAAINPTGSPEPVAREATEPNAELVAAEPLDPAHLALRGQGEDTDPYRPAGKKQAHATDPEERPTLRLSRDKLNDQLAAKKAELDDGWGPPGTTIPPPFLGALPDSYEGRGTDSIPIPAIAEPRPRRTAAATSQRTEVTSDDPATDAMLDVIAAIDEAQSRDEIIAQLCGYVEAVCGAAVFCASHAGALRPFGRGTESGKKPHAPDPSSPLYAVMTERKPFCGQISGPEDQAFINAMLGAHTAIAAAAITVRGRTVGVLMGPAPAAPSEPFIAHLTVVARAGGRALERILRARKAR